MNVMAKKSVACRRWLVGKAVLCLLQLAERGGHGLQEEVGLLEQVSKLYRSTVLTLMLAKAKFCVLVFFNRADFICGRLVTDMVCQPVPSPWLQPHLSTGDLTCLRYPHHT